jgi:hypothetical protein
MAVKTDVVSVVVAGVNPKNNGIKDSNGVWHTLSKFNEDLKIDNFKVGYGYTIEEAKGKGGGLFVQKILSSGVPAEKVTKVETISAKKDLPEVKKSSYDERNTEIGLRGFIQSAAIAASQLSVTSKDHAGLMEEIFDNMVLLLKKKLG